MGSYGRETGEVFGSAGITLTADGAPVAKVAGATIAWAGVPALAADYTFKHDYLAPAGAKVIRYGTIICRITAATDGTEVGKFMPYMAEPDGGRTLSTAEGDVFAVNETVNMDDRNSDYPAAIDGGRVYRRRLLVIGFGDGTENTSNARLGAVTVAVNAVTAVAVTNGGFGYSSANPPTVTITGDGAGATATATVSAAGVITGIVVTAGGAGYTAATATVTGGGAGHIYTGDSAENAADLAALGLTPFVAATFKTALPQITFVTES